MNSTAFIEYVKQDEDLCMHLEAPAYQMNICETWGGRFIAPLKYFLKFDTQQYNLFYKSALTLAEVVVSPFAMIGACVKQIGATSNPGYIIREEIIKKKEELKNLGSPTEYSEIVTINLMEATNQLIEGHIICDRYLTINEKLVEYLKKEESENIETVEKIFSAMKTPLIGHVLLQGYFKEYNQKQIKIPAIEKWCKPHILLTSKIAPFKEVDSYPEFVSIMEFAKEVAPEDIEWHEEIKGVYQAFKVLAEKKFHLNEGKKEQERLNVLITQLQNVYKNN
jgi:hypothetical protein